MNLTICCFLITLSILISTTTSQQKFTEAVINEILSKSGNQLICPISVEILMALLSQGAQKTTLDEISNVFGFDQFDTGIREYYKSLTNNLTLKEDDDFNSTLQIANKIYVETGYEIDPNFSDIAINDFLADVENIQFSDNEKSAQLINDWVENRTSGKIKNLVSSDDLHALTPLMLVNAIYFKQRWDSMFNAQNTQKATFYLSNGTDIEVDMMNNKNYYAYRDCEELDAQILQLPYANEAFSMIIVLPKKNHFDILKKNISKILNTELVYEYVNVSLPKFRIESSVELTPMLKKFGMVEAFSDNAQFDGILRSNVSLKISKVLQKTFIEVSEDGTEGAAATTIQLVSYAGFSNPDPITFEANKPFLFFIKSVQTRSTLFLGLLQHP